MRRLSSFVFASACALSCAICVEPAIAAPPTRVDPAPAFTRTDPRIALAFAYRARTGTTFPLFTKHPEFEAHGRLPILLRFAKGTAEAARARLVRRGIAVEPAPILSGAHRASITREQLRIVEGEPAVTRISSALPIKPKRPMDMSASETRVDLARRALRSARGEELDGRGVVVLDIDGDAFVLHPSLFRADAGVFPWVDVDKNGRFTLGRDGVDIDGSGSIDESERLVVLKAEARVAAAFGGIDFTPWRDYLFIDRNGNGRWDRGAKFGDDVPAFGEPIYVLDDADGDESMKPSERLLRLGSSKLRGVLGPTIEHRRGGLGKKGISQVLGDVSDLTHATPVLGILAGGQGTSVSRFGGLAPGVDLLLSSRPFDEIGSVEWGLAQGANVILTEFAVPGFVSLDGSTELEAELDAAVAGGAVVVSPAGNLASSYKHRTVVLKGGATTTIGASLARLYDPRAVSISIHHRGVKRVLDTRMRLPNGVVMDFPEDAPEGVEVPDAFLSGFTFLSPRATWERHYAFNPDQIAAKGNYEISIALDAGPDVEADVYVMDDVSAWGGGFSLEENTPSRTICYPATGDRVIAVGAYTLRGGVTFGADSEPGQLAAYSSRGPRVDGDPGIDVVAPANPLAPSAPLDVDDDVPHFEPFGGTSGAGPHVAAAAALVKQVQPEATAADIVLQLLLHTRTQPGDVASELGRGKLDVLTAVAFDLVPGEDLPKVAFRGPTRDRDEVVLALDVLTGAASELRARWDDDYDGVYDTSWAPLSPHRLLRPEGAPLAVRVEVMTPSGRVAGDTLLATVPGAAVTAAAPAPLENLTAGGGGCSCSTVSSPAAGASGAALAVGIAAAFVARRRKAARSS